MKTGVTVLGNPIKLNGNSVTIFEGSVIKKFTFIDEKTANEFFNRKRILNKRGRKEIHKTPQVKVWYNQLIIQL